MIIKSLTSEVKNSGDIDVYLKATTDNVEEVVRLSSMMSDDFSTCDLCDCCCDDMEYKEPIYGGAYYDEDGELIYIERVIYNKPVVIIMWSDGTKTRSTCSKEDVWNPELGLSLGVLKKAMGQDFVNKLLQKEPTKRINISHVLDHPWLKNIVKD